MGDPALGPDPGLGAGTPHRLPYSQRPRRNRGRPAGLPPGVPPPALPDSRRRVLRVASRRQGRTTVLHRPADGRPLAFAGLWDRWERDGQVLESGTILVTPANALLASIHDRMPAILDPADEARWLDPAATDPGRPASAARPLSAQAAAGLAGRNGGECHAPRRADLMTSVALRTPERPVGSDRTPTGGPPGAGRTPAPQATATATDATRRRAGGGRAAASLPRAPVALKAGMNNALFYGTPLVLEIHPMSASLSPEIRRFQRRGEPYPVYYAPEMAMRAHDYHYLLGHLGSHRAAGAGAVQPVAPVP